MANLKLLNNVEHLDITVDAKLAEKYGDDVGGSLIFPEEFLAAQKEYPIVLQKNEETNEYQFIVLFGFQNNENLLLGKDGWSAQYIPALMKKDPFYIGFQKKQDGSSEPVIHIDLDSPRVKLGGKGVRVFLEAGGYTPFLEEVKETLLLIHEGLATSKALIKVLEENDLIEQFSLEIQFDDGSKLQTEQYYTINQEKLASLEGEIIADFHKKGVLQLMYLIQFSAGNIKELIAKKNQKLKVGQK